MSQRLDPQTTHISFSTGQVVHALKGQKRETYCGLQVDDLYLDRYVDAEWFDFPPNHGALCKRCRGRR